MKSLIFVLLLVLSAVAYSNHIASAGDASSECCTPGAACCDSGDCC